MVYVYLGRRIRATTNFSKFFFFPRDRCAPTGNWILERNVSQITLNIFFFFFFIKGKNFVLHLLFVIFFLF